ncbi:MAG TPA: PAS domain S-box protein [Pyrinomonadaceae bacterium]
MAKETSQDSQELFRLIAENVHDFAVFATDLEGRIASWNPGVGSLLGFAEGEWVGEHASIIFTPEDRERGAHLSEMETALREGRAEDQRWHLRRDGSRFWADGMLMLLRDQRGGARGFAKIIRDDTARRLSEERLGEQLGLTETITGTLLEGIHVLDGEGRITFANSAALEMLGYDAGELIGKGQHETVHSLREDGSPHPVEECPIVEVLRTGEPLRDYETVYTRKDGSQFPVLCTSAPIRSHGRVSGAVMTFHDISERRRAEARLQESEERFRTLAETAADVIVTIDGGSRILFINPAAEKVFGYRPEELAGQSLSVLMPEYLRRLHQAGLERYVETGRRHVNWDGIELPGLHRDGHEVPLEVSFGEFRRGGRHVFTGIIRDITERKRREARDQFLIRLDDAVRTLSDPDEIVAASARLLGEHLGADRCAYAQVEADEDHFLLTGDYTRGVPSIVGRFAMSQFGAEALRLSRVGEPYVVTDVDADPRVTADDLAAYRRTMIRAVVSMPLLKGGRFVAGMAVHQKEPRSWSPQEVELLRSVANRCWESIERARAARSLRESEERLRTLTNTVPALVWVSAADGSASEFNDRWYEYTGMTPERSAGFGWGEAVHPDDRETCFARWEEARTSNSPYEVEVRYRRADGGYRWFLARALPVRDTAGNVETWFGASIDIEDRKRAEAEREDLLNREREARAEAERANRLKDEFLATVSHELRTPLTAILGWSQLMRRGQLEAESAAKALETIERNARSQAQLIDDLLDVSRIVTGKLRLDVLPVDPHSFIDAAVESVRPAAEAKGVRLQKVIDTGVETVMGDPARLQQVVWNLLTNAVKFTPRGGRVQVRLERVNSHVEIAVADTGAGIAPEFLPHVFERFRQADQRTTRRHGGLGLGLAIVRHLVELHGGAVRADSGGKGAGSTFTVSLPVSPIHRREEAEERVHPAARDTLPAHECPERLDGLRVLVVDDEQDARELLAAGLGQCGAQVTTASSAREALEALTGEKFGVLISDIGMPGEDGYELIRRVRALPADGGGMTPAVALTAYARAEDRLRAMRAGFEMHVAKPVELTELIVVIANLARRGGQG